MNVRNQMRADRDGHALLKAAAAMATEYHDQLDDRSVYPSDEAIAGLAAFDEPLPDEPQPGLDALEMLHRHGSPATVATTGGRYFGFVNGATIPAAGAARWLADAWDQNAAAFVMSPVAAALEDVAERWSVDLLGLPTETAMGLVTGTSTANLVAIASARWRLFERAGYDVNADGLFGAPPLRVVMGAQAHSSVEKALAILGMGHARVERVPADDQGRMRAEDLPALDDRTIVILQAGHVATGAFDPFEAICDAAGAAGAWVHVDGAFGLWAAASPAYRHLTAGYDRADSWAVDGHKTLNAPYDSALALCRDREALMGAMSASGAYLVFGDQRDAMQYTPEMSRRARGVELWAALRSLGRAGVADLVDGLCERAQQFADELSEAGFTVLNDVVFNQTLVTCGSGAETSATLAAIQRSGEMWCGGTTWNDEPAIRISVSSWVTTPADVTRSVAAMIAARDQPLA